MDITLLRTFLEVRATGSFAHAAERLFVTQSAVSLRIRRLEDALGKSLFTRSKSGAELTNAGRAFEGYAGSLVRVWQEARQQIAIPDGFTRSLSIGAQYSLWPRLGFLWIDALRNAAPDLSIRAELGMPDRLTRFLIDGTLQAALLYAPQLRPGLTATRIADEELVLVAGFANPTMDLQDRYAFVDWGPEFVQAHADEMPTLTNPGLTLALGAMGAEYIQARNMAAYLPARYVKPYLDAGRLHLVPEAPIFPFPIWSVFRDDLDPATFTVAHETLTGIATAIDAETDAVVDRLGALSASPVDILGDA